MNPRVILVGFFGGILASSALRNPLTVFFPAPYVSGWPAGDARLAGVLTCTGLLLLILTGGLAARLGGMAGHIGGAWAGAVGGAVAGLLVFAAGGAAAAGVYGSRILLVRPMQIASSHDEFMVLLSEAVLQTVFWTHLGAWLAILGGTALGALGGALAGGKSSQQASYTLVWLITAVMGMLASALALIANAVVFGLLPEQITKASAGAGHTLSLPIWTITSLPLISSLSFTLLFQVITWLVLRHMLQNGAPALAWCRWAGYLAAALPLVTVAALYVLSRSTFLLSAVNLILLILCLIGWPIQSTARKLVASEASLPPHFIIPTLGWIAFLSVSATTWIAMLSSTASLNVVMLVVTQIVLLSPDSAGSASLNFSSMSELVNSNLMVFSTVYNSLIWAPFIAGILGVGTGWLWESGQKRLQNARARLG